jgi:2'-5' RNA ligase
MTQFFVGIVPPNDYKEKIIEFQKKWKSNHMWKVAEPHITVKAQSGLGTDLVWLDNIKRVCASFPRFQVSLGQPETFDVAVAYLSVHSAHLRDFHERLVSAVSPPPEIMKRYMEMDRFVPHLTLGQTHWGMKSQEIVDMKESASVELAPFPTFTVDFVRVYHEIEKDIYVPYEDIELA